MFSEKFNPWMKGVSLLAEPLTRSRQPLAQHHPLIEREREAAGQVSHALERLREGRDAAIEQAFRLIFQSPDLFFSVLGTMGKTGDGSTGRHKAD